MQITFTRSNRVGEIAFTRPNRVGEIAFTRSAFGALAKKSAAQAGRDRSRCFYYRVISEEDAYAAAIAFRQSAVQRI